MRCWSELRAKQVNGQSTHNGARVRLVRFLMAMFSPHHENVPFRSLMFTLLEELLSDDKNMKRR